MDDGYNSNLPSLTDFQFAFAVRNAFTEDFGWKEGLSQLYYLLSQDFLYSDPMNNVTFLDNHDISRFFKHIGKDKAHFKMAYAFLMTTRGIPQVYYGTELMMAHENRGGDDEGWRQTMPGGWADDDRSVFTKEGRTDTENEIFDYVTALTTWRKNAIAIHQGKLVHFVPENNVYIYFRTHKDQTVMVVMNANEKASTINVKRLNEILGSFSFGTDILSSKQIDVTQNFEAAGKTTSIWELK